MPDSSNSVKSSGRRKLVRWAAATFIVLMIVALFVFQPIDPVPIQSKESVLKIDLMTMREAIDRYTLDRQKPPQSLQDLVDAKYLRAIPVDPMTNRRDWKVELTDMPLSPNLIVNGVSDVHSNSRKISRNDTPYSMW